MTKRQAQWLHAISVSAAVGFGLSIETWLEGTRTFTWGAVRAGLGMALAAAASKAIAAGIGMMSAGDTNTTGEGG
jgi:hypothetical protein